MQIRSRISPRFFVKQIAAITKENWQYAFNLFKYQMAKESFNLRHPFGATHGRGDGIELVSIRITDMCNLRCHTCGQWGDNGYLHSSSLKDLKAREVPLQTYKDLVDQIADKGWKPVWYIWGGEPMMYPGMVDLLYYIKDKGMPISMVSNGTKIGIHAKEIVDTCTFLYLSVDGPNAEIHDTQRPAVSGKYSNFKDVEAALNNVKAEKENRDTLFPYIVPLSCITAYNIDYVVDLYKFTSQYADAQILYLTWWIDQASAIEHSNDYEKRFGSKPQTHYGWIGDWKDFDLGIILDKYQEMIDLSRKGGKCPPMMMPELYTKEEINIYYKDHSETFGYNQCVSIYMTLEIDSNGDVSLCRDYHDYIIGNIQQDKVEDMWNNEAAVKFRQSISQDGVMPVCRRCCGLMGF